MTKQQVQNGLSALFLVLSTMGFAQVTLAPAFATQTDTITLTYDATQGNAGLVGVNTVYIHTGVITNLSTGPSDWQHVQGTWGVDDPRVRMTNLGNNLHQIKFYIPTYYSLSPNETVQQLAMVFRNVDGSKEGKTSTGGDIYAPIYTAGLQANFTKPSQDFGLYQLTDTLFIEASASQNVDFSLYHENTLLVANVNNASLSYKLYVGNYGPGKFNVHLQAQKNGVTLYDTIEYLARGTTNVAAEPRVAEEGITVLNQSTLYFKLRAPNKAFVYLLGDFNDWELRPAFDMNQTPDGEYFWLEVTGLDPEVEYRLQYYVGEEGIRIADPYSEKILDPWNDQWISSDVYPNLISFPFDKASLPVTAFKINQPTYTWDSSYTYNRPEEKNLAIYEMLIRDFDAKRTYQSVIERLPYFDSLGINAIELMPIMEFEGNESWGYNPMFFMAPDKYYGTKNDFKALVDSCHKHGIAVLLDIALNHAFGQSPLVRMYFENGQPTANSPYFNSVPKHDFNVGYDFNHEAPATIYHTKRVIQHWVKEYKIDGYRMDLSKGFTQKNSLGNVGLWGQYDQSRIDILNRIKGQVEEIDADAIMILEHFADGPEEQQLARDGFLLWGNENHQYNEATMAFSANLSSAYHKNRGFSQANLVAFMESHDEERLMYRNLNFGNTSADYSTKELDTALQRAGAAAAFFFTIPGPKMMWQFGEMGYDYSINYCKDGTINNSCRVGNKPVRWDYYENPERRKLQNVYAKLLALRRRFPNLMQTDSLSLELGNVLKTIQLHTEDSNMVVLGNFGISERTATLTLPKTGSWYNYFSGDSLYFNHPTLSTNLKAGEFWLLTDFRIKEEEKPQDSTPVDENPMVLDSTSAGKLVSFFPNPTKGNVRAFVTMKKAGDFTISLFNTKGAVVYTQKFFNLKQGVNLIDLGDLSARQSIGTGLYYYRVNNLTENEGGRLLILE